MPPEQVDKDETVHRLSDGFVHTPPGAAPAEPTTFSIVHMAQMPKKEERE